MSMMADERKGRNPFSIQVSSLSREEIRNRAENLGRNPFSIQVSSLLPYEREDMKILNLS